MRQLTLFDFVEYEYDIPAEVSVLSLFDGMSCGMIAMLNAGLTVKSYDAYEIDKYAIKTASHNFPMIRHHGDVFSADFAQYEGVNYVIGGSPCTYWSIAQKNNRETEASGMGWELFQQYVRAVREAKPKYFIYENNKSMSSAIRCSITETFGFEPICINSALVSAQHRQRLYWVGKRNADGTYSKVDVEQPEDKGILLRDVLDGRAISGKEKAKVLCASYYRREVRTWYERVYSEDENKQQHDYVAEPVAVNLQAVTINATVDGKGKTLIAQYYKSGIANFLTNGGFDATCVAEPVSCRCRGRKDKNGNMYAKYECRGDGKSNTLDTNTTNGSMVAEPVCVAQRGRYSDTGNRSSKGTGTVEQFYEAREDGKTNAVTTVQKDNAVAVPVRVGFLPRPNGDLSKSAGMRIYSIDGKGRVLIANGGGQGAKTGLYAIPIEFDEDIPIKAVSCADGKTYDVYEVRNGLITIKDKQYPIKLADGFYIIRKLTISECKRLQTVPEWYDFSVVSNTQAYKMLGNGFTCDIISHLIRATRRSTT